MENLRKVLPLFFHKIKYYYNLKNSYALVKSEAGMTEDKER